MNNSKVKLKSEAHNAYTEKVNKILVLMIMKDYKI